MWTIIILVLFVVAGVAALALALRAKPAQHKRSAQDGNAPVPATPESGGDGNAD